MGKSSSKVQALQNFVTNLAAKFGGSTIRVSVCDPTDIVVFTVKLDEENGFEAFEEVRDRPDFIYSAGYRLPDFDEWVDDHVVQFALEIRDED